MKKNTKKRRTIRRLLIATAFALLMIPASVSADVVGKKITENYTPDRENPLSKNRIHLSKRRKIRYGPYLRYFCSEIRCVACE